MPGTDCPRFATIVSQAGRIVQDYPQTVENKRLMRATHVRILVTRSNVYS